VFEIAKTGSGYASTPTTLVSFDGKNGFLPVGNLIADANGDLFGTTQNAGAYGDGTVFEIAKTSSGYASTPTILVSFSGTNGVGPDGGLIADANGDLFGTTVDGGASNDGTVFEIPKTASGYASTPTTLVSFDGTNGANPDAFGSLIADANGDLFGTTSNGGANGDGTVFEITGSGFVVSDQDKVAEKPTLTISNHSITVAAGGSIALPISVSGDWDDTVSVKISGVPKYETITAGDGDVVAKENGSYTFSEADVASGLTLHSSYGGHGHPKATLRVDALNTTASETAHSASQTIKVSDPAAPSSWDILDLFAQPTNITDLYGSPPDNTGGDQAYWVALAFPSPAPSSEPLMGLTSDQIHYGLTTDQPQLTLTSDHYSGR
jgi:uncharacterized repeat protein (TIGR03803 family)